jgi:hypothetical protein
VEETTSHTPHSPPLSLSLSLSLCAMGEGHRGDAGRGVATRSFITHQPTTPPQHTHVVVVGSDCSTSVAFAPSACSPSSTSQRLLSPLPLSVPGLQSTVGTHVNLSPRRCLCTTMRGRGLRGACVCVIALVLNRTNTNAIALTNPHLSSVCVQS